MNASSLAKHFNPSWRFDILLLTRKVGEKIILDVGGAVVLRLLENVLAAHEIIGETGGLDRSVKGGN